MDNEIEKDLNFSDITITETKGVFEEIEKKMISESFAGSKWVIKTTLTINSEFGTGEMVLDFYYDKNIFIIEYIPSIRDVFYNPDIQKFSSWCQEKGWNIPQPHIDLIRSNKEFWKHFYDTLIIDSDHFDNVYGKRPQLEEEDG